MSNPYENLPQEAFWRPAIAEKTPQDICNLWKPKFQITKSQKIVTSGSCFAQHISKAFVARGYQWLDAEPAPKGLSPKSQTNFGYGVFSFRTGNIYTAALLKQWLSWALLNEKIPEEFWQKDGRFYDPFRPAIEPKGFKNQKELLASRGDTIKAIKFAAAQCHLFVFTLGLTEAWRHKEHGYIYPMCPGTLAGEFNENLHEFVNFKYAQIHQDLREAIVLIRQVNPKVRFLLTVSPVPLTATASNKHVLVATTYSKSTLRAVAGDLSDTRGDTDYFPSYEIITSPPFRGMYYEKNQRSVKPEGVDFVMNSFFASINDKSDAFEIQASLKNQPLICPIESSIEDQDNEVVCEEELLAAFGNKK